MRTHHTKKKKGEMLCRVRKLQEQTRKAEMLRARQQAHELQQAVETHQEQLRQLDAQIESCMQQGASMRELLRLRSFREGCDALVTEAKQRHREALTTCDAARGELHRATQDRRVAERLLDFTRERQRLSHKRQTQKFVDESNCARAARAS